MGYFKYLNKLLLISFLFISFSSALISQSKASSADKKPLDQITLMTLSHMNNMARHCVGNWEREECIKELSSLGMDMTTNYAETLDAGNKTGAMEVLKQHCAASTAALKIEVPAYAMKSAITECVNSVFEISEATSIKPDLNLYQLLVGSVLCLGKEPSCEAIEKQLLLVKSRY